MTSYVTLCNGFEIDRNYLQEMVPLFGLDYATSPKDVVATAIAMARAFIKIGYQLDVIRVAADIIGIQCEKTLKPLLPREGAELFHMAMCAEGGEATNCFSNMAEPSDKELQVAMGCIGSNYTAFDRDLINIGVQKPELYMRQAKIPNMFRFQACVPIALLITMFYTPAVFYSIFEAGDEALYLPELIVRALAIGFLLVTGVIRPSGHDNNKFHHCRITSDLNDPILSILTSYAAEYGDPDGSILRADEYPSAKAGHNLCKAMVGRGALSLVDIYAADMRNSARYVQ